MAMGSTSCMAKIRRGGGVSAALAFRIMATCAAGPGGCSSQAHEGTGADTHLSQKQHSHRRLGLQKRNLTLKDCAKVEESFNLASKLRTKRTLPPKASKYKHLQRLEPVGEP